MLTSLRKTEKISYELPAVYVINKTSDLAICAFSDAENEYAVKRIERGDDVILVHNLNRYSCLVVNDNSKPFFNQLESLRKVSTKVHSIIKENDNNGLITVDVVNDAELIAAFIEGLVLSNYRFDKYLSKPDKKSGFPDTIDIYSTYFQEKDIEKLEIICKAVYLSRDLVNEPLSHMNAVSLAERIQGMGNEAGFTVEVLNKKEIERLGMGGLIAVNRGSIDPPTFSILEWKPSEYLNEKPFILIGKGIVFDTGGLSLKPTANSMDYMKCDMAGAAAVAGAMYAIAASGLPVHVIGLIPATDNRPDGNAMVPGDVITMMDRTTVEVMNTDAEGRLILADALSYSKKYDPLLVIDLATLTGSASAAIGTHGAVSLQKSADVWHSELEESGYYTHERLAQFPLWEEYGEMLKSDIADLKNIGGKEAGAITAAKFLEHFVSFPWIHIDIAGPAFLHSADTYRKKGGSAVGVRLLFEFFRKYSKKG
ncbi:MAG: M17 family metallopeptidase [Bacteroidales bacterium]